MTDNRENLPSASGADRLYACPGSLALEAQAPEGTPSDEALQGQEIHEAKETEDFSGLNDEALTIAEHLTRMEVDALNQWFSDFKLQAVAPERELRLWIRDALGKKLASAKPDVWWIVGRNALVLDYKSGYLPVSRAFRNIQARWQALAIFSEYPKVQHVRAGTAQFRFSGKLDLVDYDLTNLEWAERELQLNLWRAKQSEAARTPGPHCRYCRAMAASICPEAAAYSMLPMVPFGNSIQGGRGVKDRVAMAVMTLSLEQLAYIRERKTIIEHVLNAVDSRMKTFAPEDLASVGWELKPQASVREIPDLNKMWEIAYAHGLSMEQFHECLRASVGAIEEKLTEKIHEAEGGLKRDAKSRAAKAMEPAVNYQPRNPTLKPLAEDKCLPETSS